jgi:uncharacterized protein
MVGDFKTRFQWDLAKAEANLTKHEVSFETATRVFADPNLVLLEDRIDETGEQRWNAIGVVKGVALLLVTHVYRGNDNEEIIRIISAREASHSERRRYLEKAFE